MASFVTQFMIFMFVFGAFPIQNIALETESITSAHDCEVNCGQTFTDVAARSCSRGCRFFVISKLLRPSGDLRALCKSSCEEAYGVDDPNFLVCDTGCDKQFDLTQKQKPVSPILPSRAINASGAAVVDPQGEKKPEEAVGGLEVHLATPIMQVRRMVARVMCNVRIFKKSVLTYFMRDDNTIMAVESDPEVILEMSPNAGPGDECAEEQPASEPRSEETANKDLSSWSLGNLSPFSSQVIGASEELPDGEETVTRVSLHSTRYTYLLHLLLLLAAVSLSLLALSYCFAVARHQRKQAAKAANLTIAVQSEPLKLVRPEELTKLSLLEDDQQAPPLPNKHDLALTHASV